MPLGKDVDLGPDNIVLAGDPAPQKGTDLQFSAHVCCGQTAGWIKMPRGRGVDLSPDNIVRWGLSSPQRGTALPPNFWPMFVGLLARNGRMDQDATWYACRLWPRRGCIRWEPSSPKGAQLPIFVPCCGQTARWIKMPLGRDVDLGPGHLVLDGEPAPPLLGVQQPR